MPFEISCLLRQSRAIIFIFILYCKPNFGIIVIMSLDAIDIQTINEAKAIQQQKAYNLKKFSRRPKVKVSGAFSLIPQIIKMRRRKMSRNKVPENETKAERFKRLGSSYATKALHRIRLVGSLSNKVNYEYTPEQVEKIEKALYNAVEETMATFNQATITAGFAL